MAYVAYTKKQRELIGILQQEVKNIDRLLEISKEVNHEYHAQPAIGRFSDECQKFVAKFRELGFNRSLYSKLEPYLKELDTTGIIKPPEINEGRVEIQGNSINTSKRTVVTRIIALFHDLDYQLLKDQASIRRLIAEFQNYFKAGNPFDLDRILNDFNTEGHIRSVLDKLDQQLLEQAFLYYSLSDRDHKYVDDLKRLGPVILNLIKDEVRNLTHLVKLLNGIYHHLSSSDREDKLSKKYQGYRTSQAYREFEDKFREYLMSVSLLDKLELRIETDIAVLSNIHVPKRDRYKPPGLFKRIGQRIGFLFFTYPKVHGKMMDYDDVNSRFIKAIGDMLRIMGKELDKLQKLKRYLEILRSSDYKNLDVWRYFEGEFIGFQHDIPLLEKFDKELMQDALLYWDLHSD